MKSLHVALSRLAQEVPSAEVKNIAKMNEMRWLWLNLRGLPKGMDGMPFAILSCHAF